MRRTIILATAIFLAIGAALAFGVTGSGTEKQTVATLDSVVAKLEGERRLQRRDSPVPRRFRHLLPEGVVPAEPHFCSSFTAASVDCSELPKDGCSVPAVRVPGAVDCAALQRRSCSELLDPSVGRAGECLPVDGRARPGAGRSTVPSP